MRHTAGHAEYRTQHQTVPGSEHYPVGDRARQSPQRSVFAAQQIKPQARTLAQDRGIRCVTVDYDALRGAESDDLRLF
jgi:RecB family endonuclease NucS